MRSAVRSPVADIPLLSRAEVARVLRDLQAARRHWILRKTDYPFYTLGAASYLDAKDEKFASYQECAQRANPFLRKRFGWLHERVRAALSTVVGAEVGYDERLALPGFQILGYGVRDRRPEAKPHYDVQYLIIDWPSFGKPVVASQTSLTLTIAVPASGAGMLVWNINQMDLEPMTFAKRRAYAAANRSGRQRWYAPGRLLVQSGHQLHQAITGEMKRGERRITLQAHAIEVNSRPAATRGDREPSRWLLYW